VFLPLSFWKVINAGEKKPSVKALPDEFLEKRSRDN